jgi:hypothetical protein
LRVSDYKHYDFNATPVAFLKEAHPRCQTDYGSGNIVVQHKLNYQHMHYQHMYYNGCLPVDCNSSILNIIWSDDMSSTNNTCTVKRWVVVYTYQLWIDQSTTGGKM